MASELKGGATVAGNKIWHAGNQGKDSGMDADKIKGQNFTIDANAPANPQVKDIWIDIN